MERTKILEPDDELSCPACGSDDLDEIDFYEQRGKCSSCGTEFQTKTLLIWQED